MFALSNFWNLTLFHKLLNQYQACLYSFEWISHSDSKYVHEISNFYIFWLFCQLFELSSAHVCRAVSVNIKRSSDIISLKRFRQKMSQKNGPMRNCIVIYNKTGSQPWHMGNHCVRFMFVSLRERYAFKTNMSVEFYLYKIIMPVFWPNFDGSNDNLTNSVI